MKHLTLIRHAKSSWGDASLRDFDRPLNERGLRDAPRIGAYLKARGFPTAVPILSSPALRAKTTAEIIAHALGTGPSSIRLEARVYEASLVSLYDIVRAFDDAASHIILVGHNPGLAELASALDPQFVGDGVKYPTCGVAHIELTAARWADVGDGCAQQTEFIFPKML